MPPVKPTPKKTGRLARARSHLKKHLIPHEENEYRPYALRHGPLLFYSISLIFLKALLVFVAVFLPSSSLYSSAITPFNVIELTNQARQQSGLSTLSANTTLALAARAKASDMLEHQYFSHVSPAGKTPWYWIGQQGYDYSKAGENLAVHFVEVEDVQNGWMASPNHRANILNPVFTEIGVGVAQGEFEGAQSIIVVQMFGTPAQEEVIAFAGLREEGLVEASTVSATRVVVVPGPIEGEAVLGTETIPRKEPVNASPVVQIPVAKEPVKTTPVAVAVAKPAPMQEIEVSSGLVDPLTVSILPKGEAYEVSLQSASATAVQLVLEEKTYPMEQTDGTWRASVSPKTGTPTSESWLRAIALDENNELYTTTLALITSAPDIRPLYLLSSAPERVLKLFNLFTIGQLHDSVRVIYLGFMMLLIAALMVNIFVKFHIQHPALIAHALGVICLAAILTLI